MHPEPIYQRFRDTVRERMALDPVFQTRSGGFNFARLARDAGVHYESLRQALTSERVPSRELMEAVAAVLPDVLDATIFPEYRALDIREALDPARYGYDTDAGFDGFIAKLRDHDHLDS